MEQPNSGSTASNSRAEERTAQGNADAKPRRRKSRSVVGAPRSAAVRWQGIVPPIISLLLVAAIIFGIVWVVRGVSVTGHGAAKLQTGASGATSTSSAANSPPLAPDFTVATLGGSVFHLNSQRGHVVVLYFMSTTCTECVRGTYFVTSAMQEVNNPHVLALALDMNPGDTAKDVTAFEQSANIATNAPLTWAFDLNQKIASRYGVLALGTLFVVDPQGRIVYESDGSVAPGQLTQVIQRYV